jgi:histidine phosphotransferase ChpT
MSDIDHRIIELLCSHLCHELISPVTAVNNGLELIGEGDAAMASEATELTRQSAAEASRRLQFYRIAYGQASGFDSGHGLAEARGLSQGLLQGSKISFAWQEQNLGRAPVDKQGTKLLLNLVALAREALPRGGALSVTLTGPPPNFAVEVTAEGTGARLTPEIRAAIDADAAVESLTPRTVQAYLVAWLARRLEAGLGIDSGQADRIVFTLRLTTPVG